MSNISIIIQREFNERVRKKSFIVTTLLMPVLMLGLMLAPALMMRYASGQTKTIVVIDRSGLVAQHLESSDEVRFETSDLPVDTARRVMIDKFGVLCIGADVLAKSRCRSSATTRVRLRPVRRPSPQWWGWGSAWCSTCS